MEKYVDDWGLVILVFGKLRINVPNRKEDTDGYYEERMETDY